MKKDISLFILAILCSMMGMVNGCKKDSNGMTAGSSTSNSFTEEFADVSSLNTKGWIIADNSGKDNSGLRQSGAGPTVGDPLTAVNSSIDVCHV